MVSAPPLVESAASFVSSETERSASCVLGVTQRPPSDTDVRSGNQEHPKGCNKFTSLPSRPRL